MTRMPTVIIATLLARSASPQAGDSAQQTTPLELLRAVPSEQARRLDDYNAVFLQRVGYFATRYRIVAVDASGLSTANEVVIRPFDDVAPIVLTREFVNPLGGILFWRGRYRNAPALDATLVVVGWGTDEAGKLVSSTTYGFVPPAVFHSVDVGLFDVDRQYTYELKPLQYTPKYAVVLELPPDRPLPPIDTIGQEPPYMSEEARLALDRYQRAMDALPREDKRVLAEIQ